MCIRDRGKVALGGVGGVDALGLPAQQRALNIPCAALAQRGEMGHAQQNKVDGQAVRQIDVYKRQCLKNSMPN